MSEVGIFAQNSDAAAAAAAGGMMIMMVVYLAVLVVVIAGSWMVFQKAGEPGWASIIPFYNMMVMARIAGKPEWMGLLCIVPCIGIIFAIIIMLGLAESFGQSQLFGIGLVFLSPIFMCILGFGSAQYQGPAKSSGF